MASTSDSKYPIPPPTSTPPSLPYDVFLSFRGKDTRNNFTGHLYDRLVLAGIRIFLDCDELNRGGEISLDLMRAIEESRIYIVVFSKNYAYSRWCLDELIQILYRKKTNGRILLPVFYDVQPWEVRGQGGIYEEALRLHEVIYFNQLEKVNSWRAALTEAANLSGFDLRSSAFGSESRLISLIVEEVLSQVKPKTLFVAKHPVGLDSLVNDVYSLLRLDSDYPVRLVGIWGMGGSGKTVIAKALYNNILESFDSSCFLANVREVSKQVNGMVYLQEQLISEILMRKNIKVNSVDRGIEMIRERLCRKKVLIVLDDLDKASQVDALAGHRNWFGRGSRIIITTRNQHLLNRVQVDAIYPTRELNYNEAMELFSWHSFNRRFPETPYIVIADKFVSYSRGLPLALEVLGAFLFGRTIHQWSSAFKKLQQIPPTGIQQILKISYDGLDDDEQREIFLDIACFFIGMDIDYVTDILNGCNFCTEIGIGILIDRCLLTVNRNNNLGTHDLLRDMGREIIRQQCPWEPGNRSRLWSHQHVTNVLLKNKGTETIEGVALVSPKKEEIHLNTASFVRMSNLRLLQMDNVNLDGSFEHLSEEIRWISWCDCSLEHLPCSLQLENLVALDMQYSKMSRVWQGIAFLGHLKILNLSHSTCLTSTPDFSRLPSLVTLILEGCTSLLQIHPSIGCLDSLLVLNLKGCEKITHIPRAICGLRKLLGYLNLSGCSNLKELPDNLGSSASLRELYADETAITKLPASLVLLNNLMSLSLKGCNRTAEKAFRFSIHRCLSCALEFSALRRLNLRDCNLSDEDIPDNLGSFFALQELDLAGNSLSNLPLSFRELTNLKVLSLDNWSILQSIPGLPPNLEALVAKNISASTEDVPDHEILHWLSCVTMGTKRKQFWHQNT